MNPLKFFFIGIIQFIFVFAVYSQDTNEDPLTVTSSITPSNVSITGRNIVVIQGNQIEKLPVNSLDELLRYIPGIEVQSRGVMGSQSDILLRGGTFQQVLVLIDGLRINDPITGHFNGYIPIALSEIEKIEVLKGASTAIYGSEAVGGVINIISKTFAANTSVKKNRQVTAQATGGQYGLYSARAGGFIQDDDFAVGAGIVSNNSTGQPQRGINGYFHNHTGSISLHYFMNENWSFAARSAIESRDFAAQNFYSTSISDTATQQVTSNWNHLKASFTKDKQQFTFNLGFRNTNDEYRINQSTAKNINKSKLWQGLANYSWQYGESTTLIAGTQFLFGQINSNDLGSHKLNQIGLFFLANHNIGEHIYISPAIRAEYVEGSGWQGVPQINLSFKIPKAQFRISAGKTIRNADFTERYENSKRTRVLSGRIGNQNLESEESLGYEAGADYFGIKGLKISGTFFAKSYSAMIDYVSTSYYDMPRNDNLVPTGTYTLAKNLSNVNTVGVEADAQFTKEFAKTQKIVAAVGVTSIASNTNNRQPTFYTSAHANFLTNFSLQYSYKSFSLGVNGLYKERKPAYAQNINVALSSSYFVLNVTAQAAVYKNKLSIFAQGNNVLNNSYSDMLGAVLPGAWWMGGLKLSL